MKRPYNSQSRAGADEQLKKGDPRRKKLNY